MDQKPWGKGYVVSGVDSQNTPEGLPGYGVIAGAIDAATLHVGTDSGDELISIGPDGVVTGTVEGASEAGRVFIESMRETVAAIQRSARADAEREFIDWLIEVVHYPFDATFIPQPPIDHDRLADRWNALDNWGLSPEDARSCVREEAGCDPRRKERTTMSETEKTTEPLALNVMFVDVGVNYGDHGQDVYRAQVVDPCETVGELVERLLAPKNWRGVAEPKFDSRIEIRVAEPKPVPPLPDGSEPF